MRHRARQYDGGHRRDPVLTDDVCDNAGEIFVMPGGSDLTDNAVHRGLRVSLRAAEAVPQDLEGDDLVNADR